MPDVTHEPHAQSDLLRFGDCSLSCFDHRKITKRSVAVQNHGRRSFVNLADIGLGVHTPIFETATVTVDRSRTVTSHPAKIRVDE